MGLSALALAWLAGTYLVLLGQHSSDLLAPLLGLCVAAAAAVLLVWPSSHLRLASLALVCLLLAAARTQAAAAPLANDPLDGLQGEIEMLGLVNAPPETVGPRTTVMLDVQARVVGGEWRRQDGRVWLQVYGGPRLGYGDAVTVRGQLAEPRSQPGYPLPSILRRQGIRYLVERPRVTVVDRRHGDPLWETMHGLRQSIADSMRRYLPEPDASLLAGILVGAKAQMPPELRQSLATTGTSHIVAVSGFNVAILAGVVAAALSRTVGRRYVLLPALMIVAAYTALTGPQPSAVRAALMASAALVATSIGRLADPLTSLLGVGAAMVAADPILALDLGFQLSFVATAGLILLQPAISGRLVLLPRWLRDSLAATLAAQVATLPLLAATFHSMSLISPLANLLIAPVLPALMGLGALLAVAGPLPDVAQLVAWPCWAVLSYVLAVIGAAGSVPGGLVAVGGLPPAVLAGATATVLVLGLLGVPEVRALARRLPAVAAWPAFRLVAMATLAFAIVPLASTAVGAGTSLRAWTLDLGGSLALLAHTPSGRTILIAPDAPANRLSASLAQHLRPWETNLGAIALRDEGELAELRRLLSRFPTEAIALPGPAPDAAMPQPRWLRLQRGARLELDREVWLAPVFGEDGDQFLGWRLSHGLVAFTLTRSARAAEATLSEAAVHALVLVRGAYDAQPVELASAGPDLVVVAGSPGAGIGTRPAPPLTLGVEIHGEIELESDGLRLVVRPRSCNPPLPSAACALSFGPAD